MENTRYPTTSDRQRRITQGARDVLHHKNGGLTSQSLERTRYLHPRSKPLEPKRE